MPIPLPPHITTLIQTLYKDIEEHPFHDLPLMRRIDLYDTFGPRTDPLINAFRCWWAIYTAELVLPLFIEAMPEEKSPLDSVGLARQLALGEISQEAESVQDQHSIIYHWGGHEWGLNDEELAQFPNNAYHAGYAALEVLDEVCDIDDHKIKQDPYKEAAQLVGYALNQEMIDEAMRALGNISGINLGNIMLVTPSTMESMLDPIGSYFLTRHSRDTASKASRAFSTTAIGGYDAARLHQFWTWWLTEALEQAWNTANEQE